MQVSSIVVEGQVCRDMYDEHPGLAYFYMDGRRQVPISHPLSMTDGKALAESAWQRYHAESRSADEYEEYDGQFTPSRVLLLNCDEAVLQCYEGNGWLTEFDSPEQWAAMLTQAGELASEASIEAGWDNFSTAKGLRAQATHLRRRVSISQAHFGMLPAPKSRPKPPALACEGWTSGLLSRWHASPALPTLRNGAVKGRPSREQLRPSVDVTTTQAWMSPHHVCRRAYPVAGMGGRPRRGRGF